MYKLALCLLHLVSFLFLVPMFFIFICVLGNGIGDACEGDTDGDGSADSVDVCPRRPGLSVTDLRPYDAVDVDPALPTSTHPAARWQLTHSGAEVRQLADTTRPSLLVGTSET